MQFVWALFFAGSGGFEPIDTGYRFDNSKDCERAIAQIRFDNDYTVVINDVLETVDFWPLSEKQLLEKTASESFRYFCAVKK